MEHARLGPDERNVSRTTDRILQAARTLVERDGAAVVTIRRVAAAAGVSPSLVIRYFGSRGQLLADVFEVRRASFAERLDGAANSDAPPRERVAAVAKLLFERDLEDHGFTREFMASAWSTSVEDKRRSGRDASRDLAHLERALHDGRRDPDVRRVAAKALFAAYVHALAETLAHGGEPEDGVARLEPCIDLMFTGLDAAG